MSVGKLRQGAAQPKGQWIRTERRLAIYIRDSFTCLWCGKDLRDARPDEITLDHVRPRTRGGTNVNRNLVTACKSCNCARADRPWREYARLGGGTSFVEQRIARQVRRVVNVELARALLMTAADEPGIAAPDVAV